MNGLRGAAQDMIAVKEQGADPWTGVELHSLYGTDEASLRPDPQLMADLGITKTHSRPHTSNDNPYSEAQFKTLKYHHTFPKSFGCIEDAQTYLHGFFEWYNQVHKHSGIGYLTPHSRHSGQAHGIREARCHVLAQAYQKHPERFVKGLPQPPEIPAAT